MGYNPFPGDTRNANNEPRNRSESSHDACVAIVHRPCSISKEADGTKNIAQVSNDGDTE